MRFIEATASALRGHVLPATCPLILTSSVDHNQLSKVSLGLEVSLELEKVCQELRNVLRREEYRRRLSEFDRGDQGFYASEHFRFMSAPFDIVEQHNIADSKSPGFPIRGL